MKKASMAADLNSRSNKMTSSVNRMLTHTLQCPICLNTFTEPKLLVCSHTFCKECLKRLFKSQKDSGVVPCPICHKTTAVPDGEVGSLQTNLPMKALVEDFRNQSQICSICKTDPKPLALTYCQECEEYMCVDCHQTHAKWEKFTGHEVVKVEDILSGKVMTKQRRKCKKHPSEVEECFCANCKKYVCFRCGMMEHTRAGHNILEGVEHEESQKAKIQELRGRADDKRTEVAEYIAFIEKQQAGLKKALGGLTDSILKACEDSIQQLRSKRDKLVGECKVRVEQLSDELGEMKNEGRLQAGRIEDVSELVGNGAKLPLEGESLAAHDTLCQDLEEILKKTDIDYDNPQSVTAQGEKISFLRVRNRSANECLLGKIEPTIK